MGKEDFLSRDSTCSWKQQRQCQPWAIACSTLTWGKRLPGHIPLHSPATLALVLQVFDNEEFDCRTPREWLDMGLESGSQNRKPVPGKALLPTNDTLGHGEQGQPRLRVTTLPQTPLGPGSLGS